MDDASEGSLKRSREFNYMLTSYKRSYYLDKYGDFQNGDELYLQSQSYRTGLDWHELIGPYILRDMHRKLNAITVSTTDMMQFIYILTLIREGYFTTARTLLADITVESEDLNEIKTWLVNALTEAEEV